MKPEKPRVLVTEGVAYKIDPPYSKVLIDDQRSTCCSKPFIGNADLLHLIELMILK
jgi:hypothetical protein